MDSRNKYLVGLAVIAILYLAFSFLTYKDYGITSDEQIEYEAGRSLLYYIQTGEEQQNPVLSDRHLPTNSTYFRGHLALFNELNPRFQYERFHLLNMIFAIPIFLMFYSLLFFRYRNVWLSGMGTLLLFLTPRFLGDLPANPKDIPFAVFFFLSLGAIYLSEKVKINPVLKVLILGILLGITPAFRFLGVSLFIIYFLYAFFITKTFRMKLAAPILLIALVVFIKSLPLLSNDLIEGFKILISGASSFEHWDNKILFLGSFITKEERPFYYLPLWIAITTPLHVLLPFLASPMVYLRERLRDRSLYMLMFLALGVNLVLYFIINPVIYNGLRHFLFLIPIIVFIAVLVIYDSYFLITNTRTRVPLILVVGVLILLTVRSLISLYPYQYVYFNELVGGLRGAAGRFDSDYWGASYKESSEWIGENLQREGGTNVFVCDMDWAVDYHSQERFRLVYELDQADFIICDLDNKIQENFNFPIVYSVERQNVPLNVVMRL